MIHGKNQFSNRASHPCTATIPAHSAGAWSNGVSRQTAERCRITIRGAKLQNIGQLEQSKFDTLTVSLHRALP
jgi:hypothetical protein